MKKILSYLFIAGSSYLGVSQCVQTLPWLETFPANSLPTCWSQSGTQNWTFDNAFYSGPAAYGAAQAGEHTGTPGSWSIMIDGSGDPAGAQTFLTTPPIDLNGTAFPALSYWAFSNNTSQAGCNNSIDVEVSIDNGANWTNVESWAENFGPDWEHRVVSLSGVASPTDTVTVRFTYTAVATGCSAFYNDILLDDISVIDCSPTFDTISAQACSYYTAPSGAQFFMSGTYTDTIANSVGCDSIITINLTTSNTWDTVSIANICGSYTTLTGMVVGDNGTYYDTIPNAAGCDSVTVYELTFANTYHSFDAAACNVYTAPSGTTYTLSGVYLDTIPNAAGCDSIMTISLEMSFDNNLTIFHTTCGDPVVGPSGTSYTTTGTYLDQTLTSVNGCDSLVYLNVTIAEGNAQTIPISACDEWTSDAGNTYTSSGSYPEVFTAASGCDSTITYDVTINSVVNTATFVSALTAEATETGATYQWVDCNNGNAVIPGATSKVFVATVNGDYACIVTKNGCTETTNCVRLGSLGIDENTNVFNIFPNPSNGVFSLELSELEGESNVEISNAAGQIIFRTTLNDSKTDINLTDVEAGIYFVTVSNGNTMAKKAIVIQ